MEEEKEATHRWSEEEVEVVTHRWSVVCYAYILVWVVVLGLAGNIFNLGMWLGDKNFEDPSVLLYGNEEAWHFFDGKLPFLKTMFLVLSFYLIKVT